MGSLLPYLYTSPEAEQSEQTRHLIQLRPDNLLIKTECTCHAQERDERARYEHYAPKEQ